MEENLINQKVIQIIESNNRSELKQFIENNFYKINFDKNLLKIAISNNNFEAIEYLCGEKSDILLQLYQLNLLNEKYLKYIINHIYLLTAKSIKFLILDNKDDFLKIIFEKFIFDNEFIISFLLYYNNKRPMSQQQLLKILSKEKNKFETLLNFEFKQRNHFTPLMLAIKNENIKIIKYLIEYGANINKRNKNGYTPLIVAIKKKKNNDIVKYLIDNGADVNQRTVNGDSPLMEACKKRNKPVIKYLIKNGAEINIENKEGETPLTISIVNNDMNIAKYLIKHGADIHKRNKDGITPSDILCYDGKKSVAKFLIDNGLDICIGYQNDNTLLINNLMNNLIIGNKANIKFKNYKNLTMNDMTLPGNNNDLITKYI